MGESTVAKAVQKVTGMWWPDADPGKLRKVADAWEAMATAIDNVTAPTNQAAAAIVANNHGPAIDAFGTFWGQYYGGKDSAGKGKGWLPDTAEACRSLAKALREFAHEVDKAIKKLEEEAAIVGGTLLVGGALAFVTFSISADIAVATAAGIVATAASVGVAVSEVVATIAATILVGAVFGAVEAIAVDVAVAQPIRVEFFGDGGYSLTEAADSAETGGIMGAAGGGLGAGGRAVAAAAESAESASVVLNGLARVANAADTLPGRMVTGAGLTYGYDAAFKTGPVMPLDLVLGAVGGAAGPRNRPGAPAPEEPAGSGVHPGTSGANLTPDRVPPASEGLPAGDLKAEYAARSDPEALPKYEQIREMTDDVPRIAENLEIDESIVAKAKEHLFLTKHTVQFGPGKVVDGEYFNAHNELATYWLRARNWNVTESTAGIVRGVIAHEYVESVLMKAGVPYRSEDPSAWVDDYEPRPGNVGAHDLAPKSGSGFPLTMEGTLNHWRELGILPPDVPIASDFSNIDLLAQSALEWWRANEHKSH
ncbi:hypothetical protein [Kitasatospora sp. NPDC096140]|uniref:WXG100-like domain-containing protein n=1 Tax=Kitasatospora sp. NPDC096140 TaxID=3155425 RepID=UPI00333091E9